MTPAMFRRLLLRELRILCSRRIYLFMMVIMPAVCTFFFLDLMKEGLPLRVPIGVVDMDGSELSRRVTRNLDATELLSVVETATSFNEAIDQVRSGSIGGFFYIPADFGKDAISGRRPTLSFYSNMAIFVPGSLSFKGFKTIAVTTSGGIVKTSLVSAGADEALAGELLQPLVIQTRPIGNPWMNYNIYLSQSFLPCLLALIVGLVTAFSICSELKWGTSPRWLSEAGGSMGLALTAKLLPQTVIFTAVGVSMQAMMFGFMHFPMHCPAWHMILAMFLLVVATQAFAAAVVELVPNMRLSMSILSLVGILCFSVAGFSFPVENMYGSIGIFSYAVPIRHYFLIYVDQALNGIPLYWSRLHYAALLAFTLLPFLGLRRLRRRCLNPVYVP